MKKYLGFALGMLAAAAVVAITPATVKAQGMPCTEATLKDAQANLEVAQKELAQAIALKQQADANVETLKAQGAKGLELQIATDAAFNAGNVVSMYAHKVNGAQATVDSVVRRGAVEQYYLDMEAKWKDRGKLDAIKTQLEGANQVTAAAAEQLKVLNEALVQQKGNAAANPALAGNAAAMEAQVAAAQANYAAKKAASDELAAQYAQLKASLNWATNEENDAYGKFINAYGEEQGEWDGRNNVARTNEWSVRWFE